MRSYAMISPNLLKRQSTGFSLVEFMIALTISVVVLIALSAIFISSSRARNEIQRANQQIENGRYAMEVLSDDLQLAGFLGQLDTSNALMPFPLNTPDVCATNVTAANANGHLDVLPVHIQGFDNGNGLPGSCTSVLTDRKSNTDVVVIRRVSTCVAGTPDCDAIPTSNTGTPWFQASLCNAANELGNVANDYRMWMALTTVPANLNRRVRLCNAPADIRRYYVRIYYVTNNNVAGDGIPTLRRADLGGGAFTVAPLAEGVENLQLEYGIDYTNDDGLPDVFVANPTAYTAPSGPGNACPGTPLNCLQNWINVMSVRVNVLARSTTASPDYSDEKTYSLGSVSVGPFNDGFKRHVFQAVVRLNNPAGSRQ